jgi:hypothetical protein
MTMSKEDRRTRGRITVGIFSFLSTGRLPVGAGYVQRLILQMRRGLEKALEEREDKTPVWSAAMVQSACRHEARALLIQRKLVQENETLTVDQYLAVLRDFSQATDARDRCLKGLKLDIPIGPRSITDCPICGRSYFGECRCAIPSTTTTPAAAGPQPNDVVIEGQSVQGTAQSPSYAESDALGTTGTGNADEAESSSPTPSSPPASASTAACLPNGPVDDATTGQRSTGNG